MRHVSANIDMLVIFHTYLVPIVVYNKPDGGPLYVNMVEQGISIVVPYKWIPRELDARLPSPRHATNYLPPPWTYVVVAFGSRNAYLSRLPYTSVH